MDNSAEDHYAQAVTLHKPFVTIIFTEVNKLLFTTEESQLLKAIVMYKTLINLQEKMDTPAVLVGLGIVCTKSIIKKNWPFNDAIYKYFEMPPEKTCMIEYIAQTVSSFIDYIIYIY
jgi:hypothetical protein